MHRTGRTRQIAMGVGLVLLGLALGRALPRPSQPPAPSRPVEEAGAVAAAATQDTPDPRSSLVYVGFNNLTNESAEGADAARLLLRYLDTGDTAPVRTALTLYRALVERENFGAEYPTLQWLCEYILADDATRTTLEADPDGRRLLSVFWGEGREHLRTYLEQKYLIAPVADEDQHRFLDEVARFNSPYRARWERSERILELLDVKPGMQVADVGAGPGFFTWRLAPLVGATGKVFAVETNPQHLEWLRSVARQEGLTQVVVTPTEGRFPDLPDGSLDRILLVSTYQSIYLSFRDARREAWLQAMTRALKDDGFIVISENEAAVPPGVVPYRGILVSRALIRGQLLAWGFRLRHEESAIPQKYLLVLDKPAATSPG